MKFLVARHFIVEWLARRIANLQDQHSKVSTEAIVLSDWVRRKEVVSVAVETF